MPVIPSAPNERYSRSGDRVKASLRSWGTLMCFLVLLCTLVAFRSGAMYRWILLSVWATFVIGSVILVIKNARLQAESRRSYVGQQAWLARSWRRWNCD